MLTVDKDWPHALGTTSFFTWYDLRSEWGEDPDTLTFGSPSELGYSIASDTNVVRINVTPIARSWVAEPDSNYGVAIRSLVQGIRISRAAFYSEQAADNTRRPYFRVIYTDYEAP
ncbi:MAG: hypothetical protein MAG453_01741 [Calditrichaeota bacterium]|nr:hypothetical protein [Calditrichota bacterium]